MKAYIPAFDALAQAHEVYSEGSYRRDWMRRYEGLAHEFAHGVVLGWPKSSSEIAALHRDMPPRESDAKEISACAVEALAMRELGARLSINGLADFASGSMEVPVYKSMSVVAKKIKRAMTRKKEQRLARQFVALIRTATAPKTTDSNNS